MNEGGRRVWLLEADCVVGGANYGDLGLVLEATEVQLNYLVRFKDVGNGNTSAAGPSAHANLI